MNAPEAGFPRRRLAPRSRSAGPGGGFGGCSAVADGGAGAAGTEELGAAALLDAGAEYCASAGVPAAPTKSAAATTAHRANAAVVRPRRCLMKATLAEQSCSRASLRGAFERMIRS